MIVKFQYSLQKDAENWVNTVLDKKPPFGISWKKETLPIPPKIKQRILKSDNADKAQKLVAEYIQSTSWWHTKKIVLDAQIQSLSHAWQPIEPKFIDILENITGKKFGFCSIDAYLTTLFISPYDYKQKYFYISYLKALPEQITTIAHELFHFHFIFYYQSELVKQIGRVKFEDIKEAVNFILNEQEFAEIILCEDPSYLPHRKLRKSLVEIWRRNKNFNNIVNSAKKFVK